LANAPVNAASDRVAAASLTARVIDISSLAPNLSAEP
jgi:hypothetical protein